MKYAEINQPNMCKSYTLKTKISAESKDLNKWRNISR